MELVYSEIGRAFGYLFVAFIAYAIYDTALKAPDTNRKVLFTGLLICAGISFFVSLTLGSPSCIEYQDDGRGGTCIEYDENSYDPTIWQYVANFAYLMTVLYSPVLLAVFWRRNQPFNNSVTSKNI